MKLPTQHAEVAMKVGGVYALGALGTKHVIDEATPLVCAAIDAMELPPDRFSFCDMGCADGGTSVEMIGAAIETIRKRAPPPAGSRGACRPAHSTTTTRSWMWCTT